MTRVHRGEEAVALLADPNFRHKWSLLYEACPYGTCFQNIPFVTAWYRSYVSQFEPLVVTGDEEQGSLSGALFLAISKKDKSLVVAGTEHAEYQVWLSRNGLGNQFIESALEQLAIEFPAGHLRFSYLPPGTPLVWSEAWKSRCDVLPVVRPLMATGPGNTLADSLKKKSNKSRLNRLERLGKLSFQRVSDPAEFAAILQEIVPLHDFRQGAAHLSFPFASDPLKQDFHLALMERPEQMHITTLRLDGKLLSAHIGPCNKREIGLGILAHSPFYSQYSVGKFHMLFLGLMLEKEGYENLDLTPGGDPYKERFASHRDEAYILKVALRSSRIAQFRQRIADPMRFSSPTRMRVKELIARVNHAAALIDPLRTPVEMTAKLKSIAWQTREFRLYGMNAGSARYDAPSAAIPRDSIQDLLLYHPVSLTQQPRHEFLREAMRRLEEGNHVYTHVLDGRLVHYGWCMEKQANCHFSDAPAFTLPPKSLLLCDHYTEPKYRQRGLFTSSLRQALLDARLSPVQHFYIFARKNNMTGRRAIERAGFRYEKSLFERTRFGKASSWEGTSKVAAASDVVIAPKRQSDLQPGTRT